MASIEINGRLYHRGIGGDPVVFVNADNQGRLHQWWQNNNIFTQIFEHPHPDTGAICPTIYVTENSVNQMLEGDDVKITIDIRSEKRGNGIKTLRVERVTSMN